MSCPSLSAREFTANREWIVPVFLCVKDIPLVGWLMPLWRVIKERLVLLVILIPVTSFLTLLFVLELTWSFICVFTNVVSSAGLSSEWRVWPKTSFLAFVVRQASGQVDFLELGSVHYNQNDNVVVIADLTCFSALLLQYCRETGSSDSFCLHHIAHTFTEGWNLALSHSHK